MNWQRIYDQLIARRRAEPADGYTEKHHIFPRCLGGPDTPSNLIALPAREHYIAHLLLAHIHGGKLWMAIFLMSGRKEVNDFINARTYARARIAWGLAQRGEGNHGFGKPLSDEHKAKLSAVIKGRRYPGRGNKRLGLKHSDETKALMSRNRKGIRKGHPNQKAAVIESNKRRAKAKQYVE